MKKTRLSALILCIAMLLGMMPHAAFAADAVKEVGTAAELRAALEDNAGAHIRLTRNISFTKADAADRNNGVYLGEGCYTIDLNGFTIKYHYMRGGEFSDEGTPIYANRARLLVINGPGNLLGGCHGLEQANQFGSLIVNGGTVKGVMGHGIRMTGGISYINGGDIRGNFGSIDHEGGIIVLNGGKVGKISSTDRGHQARSRAIVKDGVFTGYAELDNIILSVDKLSISKGSSVRITLGGGLIVDGSFVNNGTFSCEAGLLSVGGAASINGGEGRDGSRRPPTLFTDTSFKSLDLLETGGLRIENGATVSVTGAFTSHEHSFIEAENGELRLLGSIDHKGFARGAAQLGEGGGASSGRTAHDAAMHLKELGLFVGVGTNPDGSTNFDLGRAPSRTEALVMLVRLLDKKDEALSGQWTHPFTDVPAWADKYVGYTYTNKLTSGVSATKFGTGTVTSKMYLTFVLRSLGYSDSGGKDFTLKNSDELARSVGILPHGVNMEKFLRADVVMISDAALSARLKDSSDTLLDKLMKSRR